MVNVRCVSCYNIQDTAPHFNKNSEGGLGFGYRLNSNGECSGCLSFRNGFGYFSDKGSSMNISSCDSTDCLNRGISVSESSSAIVGPFFYSSGDGEGIYISDASFARGYQSQLDFSGFDTATGRQGGGVTVMTNSTLNLQTTDIVNYGKNGIQASYNSSLVGDNIKITENTSSSGDAIHSTYGSMVRVLSTTTGTASFSATSLLAGYIEVNGAEI